MDWPLRSGVFIAPFHPVPNNATLCLEQDLQVIELLDRLGFHEAWVGEHHSGGLELVASPELFIAVAAQRTRHIRLGTGVSSLPYHHPFMLADRMVMLDHLTRGRAMLGCGPGQLPTDAHMMGIDPNAQRRMMEESLDAIMALFLTEKPVTIETDWFTVRDARLQVRPFTFPHMEVAVAGSFSPAGPKLAGRHGVGLLSIGATSPQGFENLATHWAVAEAEAERAHTTIDRRKWRLVAPMFLADTEAEARRALRFGYEQVSDYLAHILPVPAGPRRSLDERIDAANASGSSVIGTADRAIAQIQRLIDASGGFGTVLLNGGYWGDVESTMRSYQIFAEQVIPHFNGQAATGVASYDWVLDPAEAWNETTRVATVQSMKEYQSANPGYHPNLPGTSEKL